MTTEKLPAAHFADVLWQLAKMQAKLGQFPAVTLKSA